MLEGLQMSQAAFPFQFFRKISHIFKLLTESIYDLKAFFSFSIV